MAIEERAKEASPFTADQEWYIKGATEQRAIDIEKACEWLTNYFVYEHFGMTPQGCVVFCNKFKQAMEK